MFRRAQERGGLTLVEVLIAVTIISLSLMPILYLASRNVETVRLDRVRVAAEAICHNTLERFGRAEDNCRYFLTQDSKDPNKFTGVNLWASNDHLKEALGTESLEKMIELNSMRMTVVLELEKPPGMASLTCSVIWDSDHDKFHKTENLTYTRYILR